MVLLRQNSLGRLVAFGKIMDLIPISFQVPNSTEQKSIPSNSTIVTISCTSPILCSHGVENWHSEGQSLVKIVNGLALIEIHIQRKEMLDSKPLSLAFGWGRDPVL